MDKTNYRDIIIDSFNNIANKEKQDTYLADLIKVQTVNRHRVYAIDQ